MATLFVGDVHACADELRELLALAQPDRLILVGDMFNKGPDPDGTWKLLEEYGAEAVLGNHDRKVVSLALSKDKWRGCRKRPSHG
jgi:bis(5'-nucleosyl)-tetraphosphatase (symmetrical)